MRNRKYIPKRRAAKPKRWMHFCSCKAAHTGWQTASIAGVIDGAIASLESKRAEKAIHIKADASQTLPEIITSPRHIERALMNLGSNAIDAMHHGGELEFSARRKGEGTVVISVKDTGPGMSGTREIFDPSSLQSQPALDSGSPSSI